MTSQSSMWLYSLIVVIALWLPQYFRVPIRWSWDSIARSLIVILVALAGIIVPSIAWYSVVLGWGFVIVGVLSQRAYEREHQLGLLALSGDDIRKSYKRIEWLHWGLTGEFFKDMNEALAFFVEQKPDEAEAHLAKWDNFPGMPKLFVNTPNAYRTTGDHVLLRWQKIIDDYEALVNGTLDAPAIEGAISIPDETSSPDNSIAGSVAKTTDASKEKMLQLLERKSRAQNMLMHVARAYAENNRMDESAACMLQAKLAAQTGLNVYVLALSFLPFFALCGSKERTDDLLNIISQPKNHCKEHVNYWLGRCARARGDEESALQYLQKARELCHTETFKNRVDLQLSRQPVTAPGDTTDSANKVWKEFKDAEFVQKVFRPTNIPVAVLVLAAPMLVLLLFTDLYHWIADLTPTLSAAFGALERVHLMAEKFMKGGEFYDAAARLHLQIMIDFSLVPNMVLQRGEYWRLITYLFLHGHLTHMLLNVFGLYFFGRMAENTFGRVPFLIIFFIGGALSGLIDCFIDNLHIVTHPSPILGTVGASGAVLAIFGAVGAGVYRLRSRIPEQTWRRYIAIMITLALAQVVTDQSNIIKNVAGFVHIAGLLTGIALGFLLPMQITKDAAK